MTVHIMLDIKTWGTEPGYDIRSIGAVVFAPETRHGGYLVHDGSLGTIRPFYIACDNPQDHYIADDGKLYGAIHKGGDGHCYKYPLTRDARTVQWWNDPERAEAAKAFADPVDLADALTQFGLWLSTQTMVHRDVPVTKFEGLRLWSHGPSFDPPILAAAYKAVGLPVPWHYRAPRDTRTCFDMAGIDDHSAFLDQHKVGTFHNALDDAICQARAVCEAMRLVRSNATPDITTGYARWDDGK